MTDARARIADFLSAHHTMSLATHDGTRPWAASVFYCHDDDLNLYFLTDPKTWHGQHMDASGRVAITINDDCKSWSAIQGLQIDGEVKQVLDADRTVVQRQYLKKFVDLKSMFDAAVSGDAKKIAERFAKTPFYCVSPKWIRFIDNSRGFGFKEEITLE